jgi:prenyltransferase beta subunit
VAQKLVCPVCNHEVRFQTTHVEVGINTAQAVAQLMSFQGRDGSFDLPIYYGTSLGAYSTFLAVSALKSCRSLDLIDLQGARSFAEHIRDPEEAQYAWLLLNELGLAEDAASYKFLNGTLAYYFSSYGVLNSSRLNTWNAYLLARSLTSNNEVGSQYRFSLVNWLSNVRNKDGSYGWYDNPEGNTRSTAWAIITWGVLRNRNCNESSIFVSFLGAPSPIRSQLLPQSTALR